MVFTPYNHSSYTRNILEQLHTNMEMISNTIHTTVVYTMSINDKVMDAIDIIRVDHTTSGARIVRTTISAILSLYMLYTIHMLLYSICCTYILMTHHCVDTFSALEVVDDTHPVVYTLQTY